MTIQYDNTTNSISVVGTDTNLPINIQTKGTGALNVAAGSSGVNISNGTTVTAITRTGQGSGYTSIPSVAISAPTTAGGVQATATANMFVGTSFVVTSGGTGYTVGDVVTLVGGTTSSLAATLIVSAVSGGVVTAVTAGNFGAYSSLPPSPTSVTGGSGTGLTLTIQYGFQNVTITNAGSGYVEQPTVTFSGGGGAGAVAYATVGGTPVVRTLGSAMDFFTPSGKQFAVSEQFSAGSVAANWIQVSGRAAGAGPTVASQGGDANINLIYVAKGTGAHIFTTASGATDQFRITNTASAVNYVQATGAATGSSVVLSSQGSDTNVGFQIRSRGTGDVNLMTAGGNNQVVVRNGGNGTNFLGMRGGNTGIAVSIAAEGSDTNIPLVLQPKGTGALQAQQTDSTATGGNARGANAVDWQTLRSTASQVASVISSVISGGANNTNTGTYSFVGSGFQNSNSQNGAGVVSGSFNTASGQFAFVGAGSANTASGFYGFVGSGVSNSTTSSATVTTQSGTMNGTTAVTLSGSNASIKVGQYISGTSIANDTYVAAISGTSLTLSKNASGSSTSTLSFFTPHGVVVGGGNNQATGSYSFIGGGGDAGNSSLRNLAAADWSAVVGGRNNQISANAGGGTGFHFIGGGDGNAITTANAHAFIGAGSGNLCSSSRTVICGGSSHVASGINSFIGSGTGNTTSGVLSAIPGGSYGTTRSITGNHTFPACANPINTNQGVSQASLLVLARETTNATPTILASDSSAASGTNQVILPNNSAYFFRGEVISGVTGGGDTKGWTIEGVIKRGANAASTTFVGTPTVTSSFADAGASTWDIAVTADTTNGGLAVTFTGQLATTIRTVAQIRTTEMTY
jgi:hypothetical protein